MTSDCHERDLLEALRDGAEQKSDVVFELVFFNLEHSTFFCGVLPARSLIIGLLLGGAPGAAGRNVVTSAPQLRSRTATTRNTTRTTRSVPDSLPYSSTQWRSGILGWKQAVGFLNRHSAALKCRCSWCSLETLVGRRLRAQRRFGIRLRCALSAVWGLSIHVRVHWCRPTQAVGDLHQHQFLQSSHAPRLASLHLQGNTELRHRGPLPLFLTMSSCLCANSQFQCAREWFSVDSLLQFTGHSVFGNEVSSSSRYPLVFFWQVSLRRLFSVAAQYFADLRPPLDLPGCRSSLSPASPFFSPFVFFFVFVAGVFWLGWSFVRALRLV